MTKGLAVAEESRSERSASAGDSGSQEIFRIAQRGIELCRQDEWERGAAYLKAAAESSGAASKLPACFYSYLGCCLAGLEGRNREGVALCQRAIDEEFYQPENYLNLARIYAAGGAQRRLLAVVEAGLKIDPGHAGLRQLQLAHSTRRRAVVPRFSRDHGLNRLLGRIRHRIAGQMPGD